jgi:hypothetical protein
MFLILFIFPSHLQLAPYYRRQLLWLEKHSAKSLPSMTSDKEVSVNCTSITVSLSSTFCGALGKEKSPSLCQVTVMETLSSVVALGKVTLDLEREALFVTLDNDRLS